MAQEVNGARNLSAFEDTCFRYHAQRLWGNYLGMTDIQDKASSVFTCETFREWVGYCCPRKSASHRKSYIESKKGAPLARGSPSEMDSTYISCEILSLAPRITESKSSLAQGTCTTHWDIALTQLAFNLTIPIVGFDLFCPWLWLSGECGEIR